MKEEDVYRAISTRIDMVMEACGHTTAAMANNSRSELKMAIRDMGFLVFEMHQHLMRLPEHSVDLTR